MGRSFEWRGLRINRNPHARHDRDHPARGLKVSLITGRTVLSHGLKWKSPYRMRNSPNLTVTAIYHTTHKSADEGTYEEGSLVRRTAGFESRGGGNQWKN